MNSIDKYINYVIYNKYNMYTRLGIEKDDLMQIGFEAYLTLKEEYGEDIKPETILNKINYEIKKYILSVQKESNLLQFNDEANYVKNTVINETDTSIFSVDPFIIIKDYQLFYSILDCMEILTDQEQHVIASISLADTPKSMTELGRELGLSKQRVSAIYKRATERLKEEYERKEGNY